nr:MAG TPA: adenine-specific methyltransferase [Caudoviricetes sp.]
MLLIQDGMRMVITKTVRVSWLENRFLTQTMILKSIISLIFAAVCLKKEPKEKGKAPAMIVFHAWQQRDMIIECGKKHGFNNAYPLYFTKKSSPQVLKANMKIVGAVEEATVLYRDKLPKFNNGGAMILNHAPWEKDSSYPVIHPTQKPIPVLKRLIEIFTDEGDVVIDPVAGSGSTLRAAIEMNRSAYGFEIKKDFYKAAQEKMLSSFQISLI